MDEKVRQNEDDLDEMLRDMEGMNLRLSKRRGSAGSHSAPDSNPAEPRIPKPFSDTGRPAHRESDHDHDETHRRTLRRELYKAKRDKAAQSSRPPTYEWPQLSSPEAEPNVVFVPDQLSTQEPTEKITADPPLLKDCRPRHPAARRPMGKTADQEGGDTTRGRNGGRPARRGDRRTARCRAAGDRREAESRTAGDVWWRGTHF
jgi:hypothetical protein